MCVKLKGNKMTPGQIHAFLTQFGKASGIWGFRNGQQANVRRESLSTIWRGIQMNRGILTVESFWERDKEFVREDGKPFNLAVIYNPQMEFAVMTVPADGPVKSFHHRMPACIKDGHEKDFMMGGLELSPPDIIVERSTSNVLVGRAA